jgi:hypothetical protein
MNDVTGAGNIIPILNRQIVEEKLRKEPKKSGLRLKRVCKHG